MSHSDGHRFKTGQNESREFTPIPLASLRACASQLGASPSRTRHARTRSRIPQVERRRPQQVADGGRTAQFRLPRRPRAAGAWLRGGSTPAAMPPAGTEALTSRRRDERRRGAAFVSSRALRYRLQAWPVFALVSPSLCSSLVHEHRKEACRRTFQATKLPAADITGNN